MRAIKSALRQSTKKVIESMFERAKARLLGRFYNGPKIFIKVLRDFGMQNTLEGAYKHTLMHQIGPGHEPEKELLEAHAEEATALMDALKSKVYKNAVHNINTGNVDGLKQTFESAEKDVKRIIFHETTMAQSLGGQQGIVEVAKSKGIDDPTVFWISSGPDAKTCKWCLEMYHLKSNPMIPRVWKMSELKQGYFKPKEWDGKSVYVSAHPNCRHHITMLVQGFGFDANGRLSYIGEGHDEYAKQRGEQPLSKAEMPETCGCGHNH